MSTGATYFTKKLNLARSHLEGPDSDACRCTFNAYEPIMTAPYKSKDATTTVRKELTAIQNTTEYTVEYLEKFFDHRKRELEELPKPARQAEEDVNPPGPSSRTPLPSSARQQCVAPNRLVETSNTRSSLPTAKGNHNPEGKVKGKESEMTSKAIHSSSPGTANVIEMHDNLVPVNGSPRAGQENQLKRKNDNIFDLESAAKRCRQGFCAPPPVFAPRLRFIADNYQYLEETPAALPSNSTPEPEDPVEETSGQPSDKIRTVGAMTRRQTKNGAKIVTPVGDNYAPQGGLTRVRGRTRKFHFKTTQQKDPANKKKKMKGGVSSINGKTDCFELNKKDIQSDRALIAERRAFEAKRQQKLEELCAFDRHHESMEYSNITKAGRILTKKLITAARDDVEEEETEFGFLRKVLEGKSKATKRFKTLYPAMKREYQDNGSTEEYKRLRQAAKVAKMYRKEYRKAWNETFSDKLENGAFDHEEIKTGYLKYVQKSPAEKKVDDRLRRYKEVLKLREEFIAGLERDLQTALAAVEEAKALKDQQALAKTDSQAKIARTMLLGTKRKHRKWLNANKVIANPAPIAQAPVLEKPEPRSQLAEHGIMAKQAAIDCLHLANNILQNKQKIIALTKNIGTINKKIGVSPTQPVLSAVPARLHMSHDPSDEIWPTSTSRPPRKPSNLCHELGASLEMKAAAERAGERARVHAKIEEKRWFEVVLERKRQKRAEIAEWDRKRAMDLAQETMSTGIRPNFHDEILEREYNKALRQCVANMREKARRQAIEACGTQYFPNFDSKIEEDYFYEAVDEFINTYNLSRDEDESEEAVQGDQYQMEGVKHQADQEQINGIRAQRARERDGRRRVPKRMNANRYSTRQSTLDN